MQLILTFAILSIITVFAVLLILLSKNSRSAQVRHIALQNDWHYDEFINFNDAIKNANFGLLNYSQNAVFRHVIQGQDAASKMDFNSFDCRAIEPTGIHNSSLILFNLKLESDSLNLHICIDKHQQKTDAFTDSSSQQALKNQYRMQKLTKLSTHQIPQALLKEEYDQSDVSLHANEPVQAYRFLQAACSENHSGKSLTHWLLAHPHLHIEISSGMLLVYQKNQLIEEASLTLAITEVAELALILSHKNLGDRISN